jgi:transposase-like protein
MSASPYSNTLVRTSAKCEMVQCPKCGSHRASKHSIEWRKSIDSAVQRWICYACRKNWRIPIWSPIQPVTRARLYTPAMNPRCPQCAGETEKREQYFHSARRTMVQRFRCRSCRIAFALNPEEYEALRTRFRTDLEQNIDKLWARIRRLRLRHSHAWDLLQHSALRILEGHGTCESVSLEIYRCEGPPLRIRGVTQFLIRQSDNWVMRRVSVDPQQGRGAA